MNHPFHNPLINPIIQVPIRVSTSPIADSVTLAVVEQSYMAHADRVLGRHLKVEEASTSPESPPSNLRSETRLNRVAAVNQVKREKTLSLQERPRKAGRDHLAKMVRKQASQNEGVRYLLGEAMAEPQKQSQPIAGWAFCCALARG